MKIYIIIHTYNEAENLSNLVKVISKELENYNYKILIVDDNSPDGTGQVAEELKQNYPVDVLHRDNKLGLGSAYLTGFKIALDNGADLIFEMDADFSHDPRDLPKMIKEIKNGNDVVIGSRRVKGGKIVGWNFWRHFCSKGAMFFSRLVLNIKTKDVTAGFRCYKRKVLESIDLDKIKSNGYAFQEEMIYKIEKMNFKIKEIPVIFTDRQKGKSKLNKKDIWEFFVMIFKLRFKI